MAGMAAGGMQFLGDLRKVLTEELPEYRDQLADERGWFRLLRDPAFQADMNRVLESHPALQAQIQGMMRGMGGGGRGGGRDGRRQGSDRGGRGPGRRGGQP